MGKIFTLLLLFCFMFVFTGCSQVKSLSSDNEAEQKCAELLQYLSDDDKEGLKSMFCSITRSSQDLDEQIQVAMKFFEGKVSNHDPFIEINEGKSVRNGKITRFDIGPWITGIVTDEGKKYEIVFCSYLINSEDQEKIGLSELTIIAEDGEECKVGEYIE